MNKLLFAIFLIFVVIVVDSAIFSFPVKNSGGKIKISIEYVTANMKEDECTDECKLWCNETCGQDLSCREMCYINHCHCPEKVDIVPNLKEDECTDECKLWCNETCGQDLSCREMCYINHCHCPEKANIVPNLKEDECTDECKLWCNETCGQDLSCREMCYINHCHCPEKAETFAVVDKLAQSLATVKEDECTDECKLWCNETCGQDLSCREMCYINHCHCPEKVDAPKKEIKSDEKEDSRIPLNFYPQEIQCSTKCINKCIMNLCDNKNFNCKELCQLQCCH